MCVTFFLINSEDFPKIPYKFIMGFNRDENIARPTAPLGFTMKDPNILAGVDMSAGGTWLGINIKTGNFACLTNSWIYKPSDKVNLSLSRGYLVSRFLATDFYASLDSDTSEGILKAIEKYCEEVFEKREEYKGYNLLVGNLKLAKFFYVGNTIDEIKKLTDGIHSIGNGNIIEGMKKEELGKALFQSFVDALPRERDDEGNLEGLKKVMHNQEATESFGRVTSIQNKWKRLELFDLWGTKTTTYVFVGQDGELSMYEQTYKDKEMTLDSWKSYKSMKLGQNKV